MKRSRKLVITSLMAGAGVSLTACGPDAGNTWTAPSAQVQQAEQGEMVNAYTYATLQACKDANEIPDTACDDGARVAIQDQEKAAPRYAEQATCEEVYGAGQCVPRNGQGGSFFTPLLTGFVIGQMMNGGFRGSALYRDQRDGGYYTPYGGRVQTDYATGRTQVGARGIDPPDAIRQAPPKVQTRTSVLSRGGFGGRMSANSYSGRSYGA
ncbi:MAG: DUF1190 domain-containing protein [Phenylobacterium sp.]|uniref:DUF1190 domain-containing protein n=1 Tax=Phenylobacterium sp. TaxID=1871053 RepID=UPI002735B9DD|nr:DUF1190 domain-containing protein [Phenylobacterium sp.]MDP3174526.1 DUF1190 domain-containing protein [Phenylobacterium sp.]